MKQVASIAQVARAAAHPDAPMFKGPFGTHGPGCYKDDCRILGNLWRNVTFNGQPWDDTVTLKAGSYPGNPYIKSSVTNPYFDYDNTEVKTKEL